MNLVFGLECSIKERKKKVNCDGFNHRDLNFHMHRQHNITQHRSLGIAQFSGTKGLERDSRHLTGSEEKQTEKNAPNYFSFQF